MTRLFIASPATAGDAGATGTTHAKAVSGLFLGRFAHDTEACRTILDETAERLGRLTRTEVRA